jgi:cytochrome P450 family 9
MIWNIIYIGVIPGIILYFYARWSTSYFVRRGVKNIPYRFPLIGNMVGVLFRKEHHKDYVNKVYIAFPDEKWIINFVFKILPYQMFYYIRRYVGVMQFITPFYMVRNLDLLKQITIKDFDHFVDHAAGIDETIDSLFGRTLFVLKGEVWLKH